MLTLITYYLRPLPVSVVSTGQPQGVAPTIPISLFAFFAAILILDPVEPARVVVEDFFPYRIGDFLVRSKNIDGIDFARQNRRFEPADNLPIRSAPDRDRPGDELRRSRGPGH